MSGRKNNIKQFNSLVAGDMSQASLTSAITDIQFLDDIGIQFTFSGAPVGNFSIEISADHSEDFNGNVITAGHWVPIAVSYFNGVAMVTATSIPTSVGSPVYVDLALLSAPYIRAKYTKTSGTGSLTITLTAKMV